MKLLPEHNFQISYSHKDDPLNSFYIPALNCCVQYDRSAGFFSSSALAVAAKGVAHLIQNGGKMRLLVGAELSDSDVEATQRGHNLKEKVGEKLLEHFSDPVDSLQKERLEVLAWMIAEGNLEIRVVLPRDKNGHPISTAESRDYYHPKTGIFTDSAGNQLAFSGSVNESETAWVNNFESFSVFFSWNDTRPYLANVSINFNHLWNDQEKDWIAIDIPEAVKNNLLKYRPNSAPKKDPLEKGINESGVKEVPRPDDEFNREELFIAKEKIIFQYLRDIPYLIHNQNLAVETAAIKPWPHQTRVVNQVLKNYPERALLCDEVGLGKTIEAGLIIRQLLLSGKVKKCLILAPKSVLRQWQEELYEKFGFNIPLYDGSRYWEVYEKQIPSPSGNPWEAYPVLLAGSQLAKRNDRRDQILLSSGWDLLVVDEAHHARRKDFKEPVYRPNRLLSLISELSSSNKITGLLLMTATPMQIHPVEVWDLLKLLGLGGKWGAAEANFLQYFTEIKSSSDSTDWDFVFDMVADEIKIGGEINPAFKNQVTLEKGLVKWSILENAIFQRSLRKNLINTLGKDMLPYIKELATRHTPLRRYVFRNTRSLLREYQRQGILHANVPTRSPKIVRVEMRADEFSLYNRIDEYISYFYQKYENERRGLGFIMTVYRRRLTSSFYAVRCSLERRLNYLIGDIALDKTFVDDDIEQDELSLDISEELEDDPRNHYQAEVVYLKDFINELKQLSLADSKLEKLKSDLQQIFKKRDTVLVFTQYTDTMDYLREQLVDVYGSQLACYSGRGGEIWNGIAWVLTTKEKVKNDFKDGLVRIMLCTESASEGLNLQTCGVLINYDMPWNPMRVEQRIGRIDRIGQQHLKVWIRNYFYQGTIEDIIYQRLKDRINWFEVVVGELQPILTEISELTRRLAMLPGQDREHQIELEISALRQRLQNKEIESLDLDAYAQADTLETTKPSPINMPKLEEILTSASKTKELFNVHPSIEGAYYLNLNGTSISITFSAECFDKHPDTVQYLTFGNPLLDDLIKLYPLSDFNFSGDLLRFENEEEIELRGWFTKDLNGAPTPIETMDQLQTFLEHNISFGEPDSIFMEKAQSEFKVSVDQTIQNQKKTIEKQKFGKYLAEKARGQSILIKAALIEIALGQQPELTEPELYPTGFNEQAIIKLQRHGFPWGALLNLAYEPELIPQENDPFYQQIKDSKRESLKGKFVQIREDATRCVKNLSAAKKAFEGVKNDYP
jgi:SNF2 family DNA or RNA helicase